MYIVQNLRTQEYIPHFTAKALNYLFKVISSPGKITRSGIDWKKAKMVSEQTLMNP